MTDNRTILLKLVRSAMGWEDDFSLPKKVDWLGVTQLAHEQSVSAIFLDGYQNLMNQNTDIPSFMGETDDEELLRMSMKGLYSTEIQYQKQEDALNTLYNLLSPHKIPFLVFKGFACAQYYPIPQHRECGDIDIYAGGLYKESNRVLMENQIQVDPYYYRHSASFINGVMIENHSILGDLRGSRDSKSFNDLLVRIADDILSQSSQKGMNDSIQSGVIFPSANFNMLFLPWHVSAHFAFERVTLRHLLDWALFLLKEGECVDEDLLKNSKKKYKHGYCQFVDILTALSIKYLHVPIDKIPDKFVEDISGLDASLVDKVWNYMFVGKPRDRDENVWKFRRNNVNRIWQERWKYRTLYNTSVLSFYYQKIKGVLLKIGE